MILSDEAARLWDRALALNRAAAAVSPVAAGLPPLMAFTDPERTPRPWEIAARLPAGAAMVYRGFDRPAAADEAQRLRAATQASGVRLLIGFNVDLALAVGADGVHLPERALDRVEAARRAGVRLVTGAAHDGEAIRRGAKAGLDALVLSPVFVSNSPSAGASLGLDRLKALTESAAVPVYALGGVTAKNADALMGTGVCGLCGIEGVLGAFADPADQK